MHFTGAEKGARGAPAEVRASLVNSPVEDEEEESVEAFAAGSISTRPTTKK